MDEGLLSLMPNQCLPQPVAVGTHPGVHTMWYASWFTVKAMKVELYILVVTKRETSVIITFRLARINKVMQCIWPVNARENIIWPLRHR